MPKVFRNQSKKQLARQQLRESLWPGSGKTIWPQESEGGWAMVPRTLAIICAIINTAEVGGKGIDLGLPYISLFCLNIDGGIIDIVDEDELAAMSGVAKKTWRARMIRLQELGFIDIKPNGTRRFGFALLRHPVPVVNKLREDGRIKDGLWGMFQKRHIDFGGTLPAADVEPFTVIPGGTPSPEGFAALFDKANKARK